jgi:hypothetical protein
MRFGIAVAPLLAILICSLSLAGAAPGAREPNVALRDTVLGLAVAADNGAIGVATEDKRGESLLNRVDEPVWYLFERAGAQVWALPADHPDCQTLVQDDCASDAASVDVSANGQRVVVASRVDPAAVQNQPNRTLLTFATKGQGVIFRRTVEHEVVAVDLSGDGAKLAVLTRNVGSGADNKGHVYVLPWPSGSPLSAPIVTSYTLDGAATGISLSDDGLELAIAGDKYWHDDGANGDPKSTTTTTVRSSAVAARAGGTWHTLVGFENGIISVYNQDSVAKSAIYSRQPGAARIGTVAMSRGSPIFAAGDDGGNLHVFRLTPGGDLPAELVRTHLVGGALRDLSVSDDGAYLSLRSGRTVHFFAFDGKNVQPYWSDVLPADPVRLVADGKADLVAVAFSNQLRIYDAVHQLTGLPPGGLILKPGTEKTFVVNLKNTGNRAADAALALGVPAGWTGNLSQTRVVLQPDQSAAIELTIEPHAKQAPGKVTFYLNHTLSNGVKGATAIAADIPRVESLRLQAPDNAYSRAIVPGQGVAFALELVNEGNTARTSEIIVDRPAPGWIADPSPKSLTVPAGEARDVTVIVQAPPSVEDGTSVSFMARVAADAAGAVELTATVGAVFQPKIEGPNTFPAPLGNDTIVTYTIKNAGNAKDAVNLKLTAPLGWIVAFGDGQLEHALLDMAPGESRDVELLVHPADDADIGTQYQVRLIASSAADPTKTEARGLLVTAVEPGTPICKEGQKLRGGVCKDTPLPVAALVVALLGALAVAARRRD